MNLESYSYVIIVIVQNYLPSNIFIQNLLIKKSILVMILVLFELIHVLSLVLRVERPRKTLIFICFGKEGKKISSSPFRDQFSTIMGACVVG